MTPPAIPEKDVQKTAIALMQAYGLVTHRRNTGAMSGTYKGKRRYVKFSEPGASDLWAILPDGIHVECECKRFGQRPSLQQVKWLIDHNGIGGSKAFWFDDTRILERILIHVLAGGRIQYLPTTRKYTLRDGGQVIGPSGDFDLAW